jgi:hypothetical protein
LIYRILHNPPTIRLKSVHDFRPVQKLGTRQLVDAGVSWLFNERQFARNKSGPFHNRFRAVAFAGSIRSIDHELLTMRWVFRVFRAKCYQLGFEFNQCWVVGLQAEPLVGPFSLRGV